MQDEWVASGWLLLVCESAACGVVRDTCAHSRLLASICWYLVGGESASLLDAMSGVKSLSCSINGYSHELGFKVACFHMHK